MKEFLLNVWMSFAGIVMYAIDIFMHWLYKITYGIPCDTFEQEVTTLMMFLGWVIIVAALYFIANTIAIGRKEWLEYYEKHEFYLFTDEVTCYKRKQIAKCTFGIVFIVAFAVVMASLLMVVALPVEEREGMYSYWRWFRALFY